MRFMVQRAPVETAGSFSSGRNHGRAHGCRSFMAGALSAAGAEHIPAGVGGTRAACCRDHAGVSEIEMNATDLFALLPLLLTAGTAVVVMLAITIVRNHVLSLWITLIGLAASFASLWPIAPL